MLKFLDSSLRLFKYLSVLPVIEMTIGSTSAAQEYVMLGGGGNSRERTT